MEEFLGKNLKFTNGEDYPFVKILEMDFILIFVTHSECPINQYIKDTLCQFLNEINTD